MMAQVGQQHFTPNNVHTHDIRGSLMRVADQLSVWKLDSTQEPITNPRRGASNFHALLSWRFYRPVYF